MASAPERQVWCLSQAQHTHSRHQVHNSTPKPVQGWGQGTISPEHGSGRVHPLAFPREPTGWHHQFLAVQDHPQLRKIDVAAPRGILTFFILLCLKKGSTTDQGGCERRSNRDTSKLMIKLLPLCLPWWYRTFSDDLTQLETEGMAAHLSVSTHRHLLRSALVPLPSPPPHSLTPEQASLPRVAVWLTRTAWGKATLELGGRSCSWTDQTQNCPTRVSWNEPLKCPTDLQPGKEQMISQVTTGFLKIAH